MSAATGYAAARVPPVAWIRNRVLLSLATVSVIAVTRAGFLSISSNRLASGRQVALLSAPPADVAVLVGLLAVLILASLCPTERPILFGTLLGAFLTLVATLVAAGGLSASLALNAAPATRLSLGPAFWILILASSLAMIDTIQRLHLGVLRASALAAVSEATIALLAIDGTFDHLSLAREFVTHRDVFFGALARHLELVAVAMALAILCGAPLTLVLLRREASRALVFAILNLFQTIPSIALFGLLIGPLSLIAEHLPFLRMFGIGGIGATPAIIALVLYSLLPLVRNATAGLDGVAPAVIESAKGMGMTEREILWQVRLPLALPALVSAVRIVAIQAIGLATIAALIGGGGLGTFVFQGIGQYALDLVLLGALPIVFLALAADLLFRLWLAALRNPA